MNYMDESKVKKDLQNNFNYIQKKIEDITKQDNIDIKQISDLQRFVEMQFKIISTLKSIKP